MTQREPKTNGDRDDTKPASRQRLISGFASRSEGIKVHGNEEFDPHRFQTFEVTPAFRERILQAPLPLLELRDVPGESPQSQQRRRAGPNDITLPDIPGIDLAERARPLPLIGPPLGEKPLTARVRVLPWSKPSGKRAIAVSLLLIFLGLAFAHWYTRAPKAADAARDLSRPASDVQLLPIGPAFDVKPAAFPAPPDSQAGSNPAKAPPSNLTKPAKSRKVETSKKTLWLPVQ